MPELRSRQISGSDGGLREALLNAGLPVEDLREGGRRFFRFDQGGATVAYGGFEPHGQYALLRSIVVLPEARGAGIGRAVTETLLELSVAEGCWEAFLLTTSEAPFFERLGFAQIDRRMAPGAILATRQAATICSTAAVLQRPTGTP